MKSLSKPLKKAEKNSMHGEPPNQKQKAATIQQEELFAVESCQKSRFPFINTRCKQKMVPNK